MTTLDSTTKAQLGLRTRVNDILPVRIEHLVHRVATRSSTKNREIERRARKDRCRARSRMPYLTISGLSRVQK